MAVDKEKQLEIILKSNPMQDDYHTGIRTIDDILTYPEACASEEPVYPDWSLEQAHQAISKGQITVYSSHKIEAGTFVTPSQIMAHEYAGGGYLERDGKFIFPGSEKVYSTTCPLEFIAWISGDEGMYVGKTEAVKESIVKEPDGTTSLLISYNNERCHATITDEIPEGERWDELGEIDGYMIYHKHTIHFDPYDFIAILIKGVKEAVDNKEYVVIVHRKGIDRELKPMTLSQLISYFGYTLEKGRSWQNERGNKKIPKTFKDINKFIDSLNDCENNAAANGYSNTYYSLKDEVTESKINSEVREMSKIDLMVKSILEGKDINHTLMGEGIEDINLQEATQAAYYEVVYGYYLSIVKMDRPTTDFGAVVDVLIDNLEAEGADGVVMPLDQAEAEYEEDEYVVGGNSGLALIHNGNFRIEEISEKKAEELKSENKVDIYNESIAVDEAAGRLASVKLIDEPYGKGLEVKTSTGGVYYYTVDTSDPKYYTPEKMLHAVQGLARRYNNDMGPIQQFLDNHTIKYDDDVTNRAGLEKSEYAIEQFGDGLKITLDNGQVYRYTVDQNDEHYSTLQLLKNGVDGMWRHGASVDGILNFLDNHAILYAREGMEALLNRHKKN